MQVLITVLSVLLGMGILVINSKLITMFGVIVLLLVIIYFYFTIKSLKDRVTITEKLLNKFENLSTTLLNTFYRKYESSVKLNTSFKKLLENTIDENRKLVQYYEEYLALQDRIDMLLFNIRKIKTLLNEYVDSQNISINSEMKISKIANTIQHILESELKSLDSKYNKAISRLNEINNTNYEQYLDAIKLKAKEHNINIDNEIKELETCFSKRNKNIQKVLSDLTNIKNEIVKIVSTLSSNENLLEILEVIEQLHQIVIKISKDCNSIISLIETTLKSNDDEKLQKIDIKETQCKNMKILEMMK